MKYMFIGKEIIEDIINITNILKKSIYFYLITKKIHPSFNVIWQDDVPFFVK